MKLAILALLTLALTVSGATTNRLWLSWDLNPDYDTNVSFTVYSQTNVALPTAEWLAITNITFQSFTNQMKVEIPVAEFFQRYFVVTASNLFGESLFSEPVYSRRLSPGTGLRIGAF